MTPAHTCPGCGHAYRTAQGLGLHWSHVRRRTGAACTPARVPCPARGGRRHGLSPAGESPRVVVRLDPATLAVLDELAAQWGCTRSAAVRKAIDWTGCSLSRKPVMAKALGFAPKGGT